MPAPSGHRQCYTRITVTMHGANAHSIVRSHDGIHLMVDYFTNFLPWPIPMMSMPRINFTKRMPNRITGRRINDSQFQFNYNFESPLNPIPIQRSKLHCYRATMTIDNRYDEEDVDGATSFQKGEITTSIQSNHTNDSKAHQEAIYQDTYREVDQSSPTD